MNPTRLHTRLPSRLHPLFALVFAVTSSTVLAQTGSGGKDGTIEKCSTVLGTLAVAEGSPEVMSNLSRYRLGSPTTMLRMMVQESGCFTVVERGAGLRTIQQERQLAGSGMMQGGSNMGGGQLQAADFVMVPSIQFAADTGGVGGSVGSFLGRLGGPLGALGGVAGGVKFKEAETTLLVSDVRSGIQVASAEGKASKMNFSLGGWGWGGMGWAAGGGYSNTPEGKLIAASLLDNYNNIVQAVRNKPSLVHASSSASRNNANASVQATPMGPGGGAAAASPGPLPNSAVVAAAPASAAGSASGAVAGSYQGNYIGEDQGTFQIVVAANGTISGTVTSAKSGSPSAVSGIVKAGNEIQLIGLVAGGAVNFTGRIDSAQGTISGQWSGAGPNPGVFIGKKQ